MIVGLVLLYSSCRFSEDCNYTGNVQLTMDWESLWGNIQKPESMSVLFYRSDKLSAQRTLLGDTIYENIPSGETDMVIINRPSGTDLIGSESYNSLEISLPTYFEGNIRAISECPMICSFSSHLTVPIEETVQQTVLRFLLSSKYFLWYMWSRKA